MAQTLELELDEQTMARARQAAAARGQTLEVLLAAVVKQLGQSALPATASDSEDRYLGMFSDEPDVIDEVVASAMAARERHPLRQGGTR